MRLEILGPLELYDSRGGLVEVTGVKQRALLATLAVRAGQVVSVERLIAEVWGEHPPANSANALQAHIRRLRKIVEVASGEPDRIVTRPSGYLLHLRPGETDVAEFLVQSGRAKEVAIGAPGAAIPLLRVALRLWRGPALEGCVTGDLCAREAVALEEHRLTTLEVLYDASLREGRHLEVVGELTETTTAVHPMRERFYEQLMVALARGGRQADALAVYDRARHRLLHELGVEPGPRLRARAHSIRSDRAPEPTQTRARDVADTVDLSRELAELQQRLETLAERQEVLLRSLHERGHQQADHPGH
jgi:SARP family transcriptional regulator, regulator of embCAB operon